MVKIEVVNKSLLKKIYSNNPRNKFSKKGDFGRLLIIGGNERYSGAPTLNALGAMASLRSGVDIVDLVAPERAANIAASFSPTMITYPLNGDKIMKKHLPTLLELSKNKDAFIIGGGLGRDKETMSVVRDFLKKVDLPGVVDADAIYALAHKHHGINLRRCIITPHAHEFYVLTGEVLSHPSDPASAGKKIHLIKKAAKNLQTTILLKSYADLISDGKRFAVNHTGNKFMTSGGSGDVLAGLCGSFLAQHNNVFEAACAAAWLNGAAGMKTYRKSSFIATDLIDEIGALVDSVS